MNSRVNRSFSPIQESDETVIDYDYWFRQPSRGELLWSDLLKVELMELFRYHHEEANPVKLRKILTDIIDDLSEDTEKLKLLLKIAKAIK